jgi:tryptophan halogenase
MKIVIVGGGTAGWMAAAHFIKFVSQDVTLIESPAIPKIGVGESVTPHVLGFLRDLGLSDFKDWMFNTGSTIKLGNRFAGWGPDKQGAEFFSFSYPISLMQMKKEIHYAVSYKDWDTGNKLTSLDSFMHCLASGYFNRFDRYWCNQYHYMEQNTIPMLDDQYLLNENNSFSHHVDAELISRSVRDKIALPLGVKHVQQRVQGTTKNLDTVEHLILEDGSIVEGDLFIDASGFHRILTKDWVTKKYKYHSVDSAWVCQTNYQDQETELVNYSQSIAEPHGWRFKVGLYNRIGNGYCFSSRHTTDEQAKEYFMQHVDNLRIEPRLIKWTPDRLESLYKGNVVAIGLSCGFIEPLEASSLYLMVASIRLLANAVRNNSGLDEYNETLTSNIDDISDFILLHYTLSPRNDSNFWQEMQEVGVKENHLDLLHKKYTQNTMRRLMDYKTMYPNFMWGQMAHAWGLDLSRFINSELSNVDIELAKMHFEHLEKKGRLLSTETTNSFKWLKENIYQNMTPTEWENKIFGKSNN